jgi:exosortase
MATQTAAMPGRIPAPEPAISYAALVWYALLLALAFGPVLSALCYQWQNDEDMGHGFFVPLIAGYALWERKQELLALPRGGSRWGLLVIAAGILQLWVGTLGAEIFLQRTSFLVTLVGLVLLHTGFAGLRIVAFPMLLLAFMVPIPGIAYKQVTFPLQLLASRLAEAALGAMGYLVIRDGNVLELAGQTLSVVEACSGIRALLSLAFFSLAYSYLFDTHPWMRWLLLAASVPVAVAANALRVVVTGVMGEYDPRLAQGFYHTFSGWLLFVLAVVMLLVVRKAALWIYGRRMPNA